jgi:hypothetical protein
MRKTIFSLVAATTAALSPTLHAGLVKPGLWEMTTMMGGQKAAVDQKCYLQKDLDDLEKMQKGGAGKPGHPCTYSDYKESGSTASYKMTCQFGGGKPSTSVVTSVLSGDTVTTTTTGAGMANTMIAKRLGNCAKSSFDKP